MINYIGSSEGVSVSCVEVREQMFRYSSAVNNQDRIWIQFSEKNNVLWKSI